MKVLTALLSLGLTTTMFANNNQIEMPIINGKNIAKDIIKSL